MSETSPRKPLSKLERLETIVAEAENHLGEASGLAEGPDTATPDRVADLLTGLAGNVLFLAKELRDAEIYDQQMAAEVRKQLDSLPPFKGGDC